MLNNVYRDDVRQFEEFTRNSNELIEDFDFDGKAVFVNSEGASGDTGHDNAIAEETTARNHDKYPGFIDFRRTKKVMILDAGYDVSTQTLLEFPKSLDEFSDYGITLVSVGHGEPNVTENYSSKAEALQALIESGIFPIFESHDDDESTEGRAERKPIKGYVYIRKANRGVDTGEPTQSGVVAWGIREAGSGYLVDDLGHSLLDDSSTKQNAISADNIDDICRKLLSTMSYLSEEDACVSVFVEELETSVSEDDGTECYIASGPAKKDQFYLGMIQETQQEMTQVIQLRLQQLAICQNYARIHPILVAVQTGVSKTVDLM